MFSRCFRALALAAAFAAAASTARAAIVAPVGLNPGDQFRLVFISSDQVTGNLPTITDYDNHVINLAAGAGLGVYGSQSISWLAMVSADTIEADIRLPNGVVPIYTLLGSLVADSTNQIFASPFTLLHAIDVDENGNSTHGLVWSGSDPTGASTICTELGGSCGGSTTSEYGDNNFTDYQWFDIGLMDQSNTAHLYAFSNVLTVEGTTAPEPSTLVLFGTGLFAAVPLRRRK